MPYGALQGDLYTMAAGTNYASANNPAELLKKGISPSRNQRQDKQENDEEQTKEEDSRVSSGLLEGIKTRGQQKLDNLVQTPEAQQEARDVSILDSVSMIDEQYRMMYGDRYGLTPEETQVFNTLVSSSENPEDAASRFLTSHAIAKKTGMSQSAVFQNLDAMSEYYLGRKYVTGDTSLYQMIEGGFDEVKLSDIKGEWRDAVLRYGTESHEAKEIEQRVLEEEARLGGPENLVPKTRRQRMGQMLFGNLGYMFEGLEHGGYASMATQAVTYGIALAVPFFLGPAAALTAVPTVLAAGKAASGVVGTMATGLRYKEMTENNTFWANAHATDDEGNPIPMDVGANIWTSWVNGMFVGAAEVLLDGLTARGLSSFIAPKLKKFGFSDFVVDLLVDPNSKSLASRTAYVLVDYLAGAADEGVLEEGSESIVDYITSYAYKKLAGADVKFDLRGMISDYVRSALDGGLMGLAYGAIGIPSSLRGYNDISLELIDEAIRTDSKEVFIEKTNEKRPDIVPESDFHRAQDTVFENIQNVKESIRNKGVLQRNDIAVEELYDSVDAQTGEETQVLPDGSVYRTPDTKRLYTQTEESNGRRRVYAGDPNSHAIYGYAEVSTDGDTLTVGSVRIRPGYEGIRAELVQEAISSQRTGESNIEWNPETEGLQGVRELLIQNNPRGREAGLDYGADFSFSQDHDIQGTAADIRTAMPHLSKAESVVAARMISIADADNSLSSLNDGKMVRSKTDLPSRYRGAAQAARAIIYAGQNADFSTFSHELFHVNSAQRPNEARQLSNAVRNSFSDEASKANLRKFIEESKEIWGPSFNVDEVMQHLESISPEADASMWTRAQSEDLARLAEAYLTADNSKRSSLSEAIRNILHKIAEFMRQIYQTVRHTVPLSKEITDAYDAIMYKSGGSEKAAKQNNGIQHQSKHVIRMPIRENTYEAAIELAIEAHPQFVKDIEDIRKLVGADESDISIRPTLKSKKRSDEKVLGDYGGDYGQNLDYDGAMIKFDSLTDAENAWNKVKEAYGDRIVKNKHLITPMGYEDYKANIRMDNGFIAEIQFLDKDYFFIKEEIGHDLYEISRTITEFKKHGVEGFNTLQEAIDTWSAEEYRLAKTYANDRGAYESSEARRSAVSSSIRQALSSALSRYQVSSESVNALSSISLPSSEGISLDTGEIVVASILNGISSISTYLKDSGIMPSTKSIDSQSKGGNLVFQGGEQYQTTEERLKSDPMNFDSEGRHLAPNGKPSNLPYEQWVTVRTPAFKEWFGDWMNAPENASRIVDENGEPEIVYHGTASEFSVFDRSYLGSSTEAKSARLGFFFTNNQRTAEGYGNYASGNEARQLYKRVLELERQGRWEEANQLELRVEELALQKSNGIVMPAFLNIRNPYVVDADGASFKETGKIFSEFEPDKYDGMAVYSLNDNIDDDYVADHYIALNPNQIKSIDNRGAFDSSNPDIYFQDDRSPDTSDLTEAQKAKRDEAKKADARYIDGDNTDLDSFYDGYDSSMDSIETPEEAEEFARVYSEWIIPPDTEALNTDASLIDEVEVPFWDDDGTNLMPDGSRARSEAEYEAAVNSEVIPQKEEEAGLAQPSAPAGESAAESQQSKEAPKRPGIRYDDAFDYELTWEEFVSRNKPDVSYGEDLSDAQKDDIFISSIQDDDTLLKYLGIIGEALFLNTRELNEDWHFSDQIQRERIKSRVFDTITNTSVRNASLTAMKAELRGYDLSDRMKSLVRKEMSGNARFYRNILSFMVSDSTMKPEELIKDVKGLDIPPRDALDLMPIPELRALAETAEDRSIVDQIERGTLKAEGGADEAKTEELNNALKSLAERIQKQETELRQNEDAVSRLQKDLDSVTASLAERDENIDHLMDSLRTAERITQASDSKLTGENLESYSITPEMKRLANELSWLNESRYLQIEAEHRKGRSGKYEYARALRDAKTEYITDLISYFPGIFEENGDKFGKLSHIKDIYGPSGFRAVQEVISGIREELLKEWRASASVYARKLADSVETTAKKLSDDIDASLRKMEGLQKEIDRQKKLKDAIKGNRNRQIFDARTEERWKAAKEALEAEKRYNEELRSWKSYAEWQERENRAQTEAIIRKAKDDAALLADWLKAKADARIAELKKEQREKRKQERLYKRIQEEKAKLGKAISKPVNLNTTDYETSAEAIMAIQAILDPHFRREWVYDFENNPDGTPDGGTMTIPEAIAYLQNLQEDDRNRILSVLSPELVARLTGQRNPLNDFSIAELRQLAEQVEELRRRGREVMRAKKAFERETRERIQKAIIEAVKKAAKNLDDTLPGSTERIKQAQGILAKWRSAKYITMRMQELSQLLDGGLGHRGAAYQLLVDEKRYHQAREWKAVDSRISKIAPLLTKEAVNSLFENVRIEFSDGLTQTYTVDKLAYLYLSQFDEDSKAAVAYGNLLTEEEKGTLLNKGRLDENGSFIPEAISPGTIIDNDKLKALGDKRYGEALEVAKTQLEGKGLMPLVEAIKADFADPENFRRLNKASIEAYNTPLKRVLSYLPIMRQDLRGDNFHNNMADALFNLNTGDFSAAIDKGMTISRIKIAPRNQRGVNMSLLEVWQKSVRNQEHLIEFAQYSKKLRGVFGNNATELVSTVDRVYSPALMNEVKGYIDYVINPNSGQPKTNFDKTLKNLRGRTGAAYLGWKLPGVVLQFCTSAWPFLQDMSPATLLKGYLKIASGGTDVLNMIYEKSPMMKHRTMSTVVQEALERRGDINRTKAGRAMDRFNEIGQLGLTWVDKVLVAGGWLGAYETALQKNLDAGMDTTLADAAAVKTADDIVLRVQPAGDSTELPSMFRNSNELVKIFLQFQSSMSVIFNNLIWDNIGFARNRQFGKVIASVVSYGMAGLMLGLAADGFDDDDDSKDKAKKLGYWFMTQGVESFPVFGSDISMILQRTITGERDYYGNGTDMFPGITKIFSGIEDIVASDKPFLEGVKDIAYGAGIFAGAPVSGFKNLKRVAEEGPAALLGR